MMADVPSGWTAVLRPSPWHRWILARDDLLFAVSLQLMVVGVWLLFQLPASPIVRWFESLLGGNLVDVGIDFLGARFYGEYLRHVALPVTLLMPVVMVLLWLIARRGVTIEDLPRAIYFFNDRLLFVGKREYLILPLGAPPVSRRDRKKTRGESVHRFLKDTFTDRTRRFFKWSRGEPGQTMLLRSWHLETPSGERRTDVRHFVTTEFARCDRLTKRDDLRAATRRITRSLPFAFFALDILTAATAATAAGPYALGPVLRIYLDAERLSTQEIVRRADDSRYLETGYLFWALGAAEEDPEVTFTDYERLLARYLGSGGDKLEIRYEQALLDYGRGCARCAIAWLTPDGSSALEARIALSLGDWDRVWRAADALPDDPSSRNFRAKLHLVEGRGDRARELVDPEVEEAADAASLATLWYLLGEEEKARELLRRDDVTAFLEAEPEDRGARLTTPLQVVGRLRQLTSRAFAARCLGDEDQARQWWNEARQTAQDFGLPHLIDTYRTWIWQALHPVQA